MAIYNLKTSQHDVERFRALAFGHGWYLALHTPAAEHVPSYGDELDQAALRQLAALVLRVLPDTADDIAVPFVDDAFAARALYVEAFASGYEGALLYGMCLHCTKGAIPASGTSYFCSPACRSAWLARCDTPDNRALISCSICKRILSDPDEFFCGAVCEAIAIARLGARRDEGD